MSEIDDKIKAIIADHGAIKTVLTVLFAVLSFAKSRAWFSRGDGPR